MTNSIIIQTGDGILLQRASVRALDTNSTEQAATHAVGLEDPAQTPSNDRAGGNSSKRMWFRIFAILIGMLPFVLIEIILFSVGWQPNAVEDPFVGFTKARPLFEKNADGALYEIGESRLPLFQPESFLVEKPDDEFRIFCVGGSTVQGRPFAIETSFSTWLELQLTESDPAVQWNAINCGGVSYASYRLAPIVDEILANYEPDLIVLYTGHNEFLEDRTYESIKNTPDWVRASHEWLSNFRTYSFVRSKVVSKTKPKDQLPPNVEARLDFKGGLDKYTRDDDWKSSVELHFEHNLRRMIRNIQSAGVPIILVNPVCNLSGTMPFKSEVNSGWSTEHQSEFLERISARRNETSRDGGWDLAKEIKSLEQLLSDQPRYAQLHFELGQLYLQNKDFDSARIQFILAKEEDICPLRITEPLYAVIKDVRSDTEVPIIDAMEFFSDRSPGKIPGDEFLVDHVHPSIRGHQLIANLIGKKMRQMELVSKPIATDDDVSERFESHLESLSFMYFQRGKDRLAGLKRWAAGKVTKERNSDGVPTESEDGTRLPNDQ